jgi:hypothetical protein
MARRQVIISSAEHPSGYPGSPGRQGPARRVEQKQAPANAAKRARASRTEVSLATRNNSLVPSIRDHSVGGADLPAARARSASATWQRPWAGRSKSTALLAQGTLMVVQLSLRLR